MNPYKAEIPVTLAGQEYTLVYDYNALCEFEELFGGKSVTAIFGLGDQRKLAEAMGVSLMRKALFVGLRKKYKNLTLEKVGDMVGADPKKMGDVMGAVTKGILLAMFGPNGPSAEDEAEAAKIVENLDADPTKAAVDSTGNG